MKLRYEVRDEWGEVVRMFATKQEAQAHCKLDPSFWIKTNKIAKRNLFREALEKVGECLF
jgi:hypothetical protein